MCQASLRAGLEAQFPWMSASQNQRCQCFLDLPFPPLCSLGFAGARFAAAWSVRGCICAEVFQLSRIFDLVRSDFPRWFDFTCVCVCTRCSRDGGFPDLSVQRRAMGEDEGKDDWRCAMKPFGVYHCQTLWDQAAEAFPIPLGGVLGHTGVEKPFARRGTPKAASWGQLLGYRSGGEGGGRTIKTPARRTRLRALGRSLPPPSPPPPPPPPPAARGGAARPNPRPAPGSGRRSGERSAAGTRGYGAATAPRPTRRCPQRRAARGRLRRRHRCPRGRGGISGRGRGSPPHRSWATWRITRRQLAGKAADGADCLGWGGILRPFPNGNAGG